MTHPPPPNTQHPTPNTLGQWIARLLAGAWRREPPALDMTASQLEAVTGLLIETRSAGLAWHRLRHSSLAQCPAGIRLREAYLLDTAETAYRQRELERAVTRLRSAGIEPLLAKGYAVSRCYPEPGLRPHADIDLLVRPEELNRATARLWPPGDAQLPVDLQCRLRVLDRSSEELRKRAGEIEVGAVRVRILSPEDHLRYLCLHFLDHGGFRPLWLCDIAVLLETLPPDFDWNACLNGTPRVSDWVEKTLQLASRLLGARLEGFPGNRDEPPPDWLPSTVLKQWGTLEHYMHAPSFLYALLNPHELLRAVRLRWPNPIQATVSTRGPFDSAPRLPYQAAECLRRSCQFLSQLPRMIRELRHNPSPVVKGR